MSPTTPPPSATSTVRRSAFARSSASKIRSSVRQSLCASPSGSSMASTRAPGAPERGGEARGVERGHRRVGDDGREAPAHVRREDRGIVEQPRADADRVAALAQRDLDAPFHDARPTVSSCRRSAPPRGSPASRRLARRCRPPGAPLRGRAGRAARGSRRAWRAGPRWRGAGAWSRGAGAPTGFPGARAGRPRCPPRASRGGSPRRAPRRRRWPRRSPAGCHLAEQRRLALAEAFLALELEDGGDGHAGALDQQPVGVDELLAPAARERLPERGLAGAHHAHEKHVVAHARPSIAFSPSRIAEKKAPDDRGLGMRTTLL